MLISPDIYCGRMSWTHCTYCCSIYWIWFPLLLYKGFRPRVSCTMIAMICMDFSFLGLDWNLTTQTGNNCKVKDHHSLNFWDWNAGLVDGELNSARSPSVFTIYPNFGVVSNFHPINSYHFSLCKISLNHFFVSPRCISMVHHRQHHNIPSIHCETLPNHVEYFETCK